MTRPDIDTISAKHDGFQEVHDARKAADIAYEICCWHLGDLLNYIEALEQERDEAKRDADLARNNAHAACGLLDIATKERDEARADADYLRRKFAHMHVARYDGETLLDECAECGIDLRDGVHGRPEESRPASSKSCISDDTKWLITEVERLVGFAERFLKDYCYCEADETEPGGLYICEWHRDIADHITTTLRGDGTILHRRRRRPVP